MIFALVDKNTKADTGKRFSSSSLDSKKMIEYAVTALVEHDQQLTLYQEALTGSLYRVRDSVRVERFEHNVERRAAAVLTKRMREANTSRRGPIDFGAAQARKQSLDKERAAKLVILEREKERFAAIRKQTQTELDALRKQTARRANSVMDEIALRVKIRDAGLSEPIPKFASNPTYDEIRDYRLSVGLSQRQAAEAIGVTTLTWTHWEMGRFRMRPEYWADFVGPPEAAPVMKGRS